MPDLDKLSRHGRHHPAKRSLNGMTIFSMTAEQLRTCLEIYETDENSLEPNAKKLLLLDCRSFVAYNDGHITGALNVHCPAILRRRSRGTLPLRTLLPSGHFCSLLANNLCYPVVLYDELGSNYPKSQCVNQTSAEQLSTTEFVARCLQVEAGLKTIYLLESGYTNFSQCFPHLCTPSSPAPSSPSSSPRLPRSCSALSRPLSCRSSVLPLASKALWEQRSLNESIGPVEILPHLWLGSAGDASRPNLLKQLGITALLNVSRSECYPAELLKNIRYKNIPLRDSPCQVIDCFFQEAFDFIDEVKRSFGKVLVHCRAGISRSATICIAYLMADKLLRMDEAYELVKSRRRIVSPNFNFMGQLLAFEERLFSSSFSDDDGAAGSDRRPTNGPRDAFVQDSASPKSSDLAEFDSRGVVMVDAHLEKATP